MTDGSFTEYELTSVKDKLKKWKIKNNITKSTVPAYAALGEDVLIKDIFTV